MISAVSGERQGPLRDLRVVELAGLEPVPFGAMLLADLGADVLRIDRASPGAFEPLTAAQIDSALEWLEDRWTRHGWTPDWITDHRQVAPGRKNDLCPTEWTRVQAAIAGRFGADGPP